MAQTRKRGKNTLDVDSPAKLRMMKALMGTGRNGVVSYVLVYAPWCGACRKFRQNIWDPSMRFPARHNRIAIRDDVFNNSPFAKKVPDLKYLPSMILVDEKGDVQMNAAPEGPTNILPTPTSVNQLVKMANVNVKPVPVAAATTDQTAQADAVNEILSKPTNINRIIANANKTAEIAKNAAAQVKANTVALNNASRNMLAKAIVNTKVAANSALKAAENAKESANSIRNMLGEIKNIVASAKGNGNVKDNTNMAAKAAAAAAVAAAAAEAAEEAANEGTNAVEEAANTNMSNANTNMNNANAYVNNANAYVNNANAYVNNANAYNTNDEEANTNAVNYEDWEKEELMDMIPDEEYKNATNFSPPDGMMSKNGSLTTKFPTPPVAPQNYKKPSNMMGGKRATHGKLYKMLVAINSRATQRKRRARATSKKLTRRAN
jgi:thiol-disulfide isomerase/thioredoxin